MAGLYGHGEYGKAAGMAADSYARFMVRPSAPLPPPSYPSLPPFSPPTPRTTSLSLLPPETRGAKSRPAVEVSMSRFIKRECSLKCGWEEGASVYRG